MKQAKLQQKLRNPNPSQKQMQQIVKDIRSGSYQMPDASFQYSYKLLKKNPDSDQKFINMEELIYSGLQMKVPTSTLKQYLQWCLKKLGSNRYVTKLTALINFASSSQPNSSHLQPVIKEDLTDFDSRKRIFTFYKRQGRIDEYVKRINQYLEQNPNDLEAWLELAKVYTERGQYMRAVFCFEQLVLLCPQNDHYAVRMGQLYYTLGGKTNIENSVKYFSCVVAKSPRNYRALWNLNKALDSYPENSQYEELKANTQEALKKFYRQTGLGICIKEAV